jgi:hypothetical protein
MAMSQNTSASRPINSKTSWLKRITHSAERSAGF